MKTVAFFVCSLFQRQLSAFDMACIYGGGLLISHLCATLPAAWLLAVVFALTVTWLFTSVWVEYLARQSITRLKGNK